MNSEASTASGRRALVTGGAHGIGRAICRRLAADGVRVAVADIDAEAARQLVAQLGPRHVALAVDLTDPEAATTLPARAAAELGGLDVIVNNAGGTVSSGQSLIDLPAAAFDGMVALNLTALERICAAAAAVVLGPGARIVNLASGAAYRPLALRGPYSATKAGVVALTAALAEDLAPRGIGVSAVAPGYTRTPLVEELHRAGRVDMDKVAAGIPLGRLALPEDIASVAAFAASPEGGVISGQTLLVDGGGQAGPAPQDAAPERGTAPDGATAVLCSSDTIDIAVPGVATTLTDRAALDGAGPLAAVIDAEAFGASPGPAEALERALLTARACAALPNRARAFTLLFVSDEGDGPAARAAVAARAMLSRTLALEWASSDLRVNTVIWRGSSRRGLGALCRFLTRPDAAFMTGQVVQAGDVL